MIRKIKNNSATILISFSLLILSACDIPLGQQPLIPESSGITNPDPVSTPTPSATATPVPSSTPASGDKGTGGLKVVIHTSTNFSSSGLVLLEQARVVLEKVLNSEEFKQQVLHFTYQGEEMFVQNNGYTNLEIYNLMMAGAEQLPDPTPANQTMDLFTELYNGGSGVIGYTDPSVPTIFMNSYYYNSYTPGEVAGNMTHEWLHKLGFDHDYYSTARRPYSVPYAIGYIAEDLAAKY